MHNRRGLVGDNVLSPCGASSCWLGGVDYLLGWSLLDVGDDLVGLLDGVAASGRLVLVGHNLLLDWLDLSDDLRSWLDDLGSASGGHWDGLNLSGVDWLVDNLGCVDRLVDGLGCVNRLSLLGDNLGSTSYGGHWSLNVSDWDLDVSDWNFIGLSGGVTCSTPSSDWVFLCGVDSLDWVLVSRFGNRDRGGTSSTALNGKN